MIILRNKEFSMLGKLISKFYRHSDANWLKNVRKLQTPEEKRVKDWGKKLVNKVKVQNNDYATELLRKRHKNDKIRNFLESL